MLTNYQIWLISRASEQFYFSWRWLFFLMSSIFAYLALALIVQLLKNQEYKAWQIQISIVCILMMFFVSFYATTQNFMRPSLSLYCPSLTMGFPINMTTHYPINASNLSLDLDHYPILDVQTS